MIPSFFNFDISNNNKSTDIPDTSLFDFKLPITYLDKNNIFKISDDVKVDLEIDNDSSFNIYNYLFSPTNEFSQENVKLWNEYYTNDIYFLKDTSTLLSNMDTFKYTNIPDFSHVKDIWNETKNNSNFYSKYNYFEWSLLKHFNLSSIVLLFMSLLHLSSPLFFFAAPLFIMIVPFFILKFQGVPISTNLYFTIIKEIFINKFFGKTFNSFKSVNMYFVLYILACIVFYFIQLYQNINTCYVFYKNIRNVNDYLIKFDTYILHSINNMKKFLFISTSLHSYSKFNFVVN